MKPGEGLWVETTDPLATLDIPAFAAEGGHRVAATERMEWGHRFLLERGAGR
jgi:tRNA 2-thiouridine synthesizing protein A